MPGGVQVPDSIARVLQGVLDERTSALTTRDPSRLVAGLVPDPDLRRMQTGYLDNLARLPLTRYDLTLLPASLVRTGNGYWGVVEVAMQLGPYDALPVTTLDRFRFAPSQGGFRIASTTDAAWEAANLGVQEPWDTEPIETLEGSGVLGVFDAGSVRRAPDVVGSVERGLADVGARVPYDWSRAVALYALSDPRFLDGFADVPGGDVAALDAVAFTVAAGRDDDTVASTRFALSPATLTGLRAGPDARLDRLVRHELAHVAIGPHDDQAPVWLSEGLAEWVSVQALAPEERLVPEPALAAAEAGTLRLPDDADFNDDDAETHYALAWWVCEWLAQTYGEQGPWTLLDEFASRSDVDDKAVVREVLDLSLGELAERGAALMAATYAPPVTEPADPTESPSAESP